MSKDYNRIGKQKKNGVSDVDFELKEFEKKINNITEQFMSLLDSNDVIESSITNKFENGPAIFNEQSCGTTPEIKSQPEIDAFQSTFRLGEDTVRFGGFGYAQESGLGDSEVPKHAVKFDSVEQMELNKQLEKLYEEKRSAANYSLKDKPSMVFSNSNLYHADCLGGYAAEKQTAEIQENSTFNNKEVYDMSNYCGEPKEGNVFYSFATIPAEKALVEKRTWKDMLLMDIPWDTQIDVWGGIKKFCGIQINFTA